MPAHLGCPDAETLRQALLGKAPLGDAGTLAEHLLFCERCGSLLPSLQAEDALSETACLGATRPDDPEQEAIEALAERLARLPMPGMTAEPRSGAAADTATFQAAGLIGTAEVVDLLAPPRAAGELGWLGPYRVLRLLGAGGMGCVFLAEDPQLRRPVALKVLKPGLARSAAHRLRFLREARATAALEHDHVVTVHQVGEDQGVPYLAMQLLHGETLEERLQRQGRLPIAEVLRLGREIAEGLAAAHARGLVHRDVKPANIWLEDRRAGLAESGQDDSAVPPTGAAVMPARVKILDFGLARGADDELHLTQSGAIAGTPAYMAPEQVRGEPEPRSDLFSLGCVLYRMCTAELPFRGADARAVLEALATKQPRPPHVLNRAVPRPLSELILRLLAKEPDDRCGSAYAVAEALEALSRPTRCRWRWLGAAVALLLVCVLIVGWFAWRGPVAPAVPPALPVRHEIRRFNGHAHFVLGVAFAPDGATAYSCSYDGTVRAWDVKTGEPRGQFVGHKGAVWALALARDGQRLLTGSFDHTVRVWDVAERRELGRFREHTDKVGGVALSPDGRRALSTSWDGKALLWEVPSGKRLHALAGDTHWGCCVAFAPDGRRCAASGLERTFRIWEADTGKLLQHVRGHTDNVTTLVFDRAGKRVLSGAAERDRTLRLWDAETGVELKRFIGHEDCVRRAVFSPDEQHILSAGHDGLRLWNVATGQTVCVFMGHTDKVASVAIAPDGRYALSGSDDATLRLWELPPEVK